MFNGLGGGGPEVSASRAITASNYFASPVSNPFFAEDPRSLTEIRPIFMFQTISNHNSVHRGRQRRVLRHSGPRGHHGPVVVRPEQARRHLDQSGEQLAAPVGQRVRGNLARAEVDVPAEHGNRYRGRGRSHVPDSVQFGAGGPGHGPARRWCRTSRPPQNFGCTSYGSFNAMGTLGYSFADHERSDYLFSSLHLDYDVGGRHFLYPLVELNWFTTPATAMTGR